MNFHSPVQKFKTITEEDEDVPINNIDSLALNVDQISNKSTLPNIDNSGNFSELSASFLRMQSYKKQYDLKKRENNHLTNLKLALEEAVLCAFILKENAMFFETMGFVNAKQYCEAYADSFEALAIELLQLGLGIGLGWDWNTILVGLWVGLELSCPLPILAHSPVQISHLSSFQSRQKTPVFEHLLIAEDSRK